MIHHLIRSLLLTCIIPVSANILAEQVTIKHGNQHMVHFTEQGENGNIRGINRDIVDEITRHLGVTTTHQICPFKRCTQMLYSGELDIMLFIAVTPERVKYIEPIQIWSNAVPIRFFTRREDQHKLQRYQHLSSLTIGSVNGYVYSPGFDNDPNLTRHKVLIENQLPKMLTAGRIDAFPTYGSLLNNLDETYPGIVLAPLTLKQWDTALLAISKQSPLLNRAKEIDQLLQTLARDGTLDQIWGRYFPGQKMPFPETLRQPKN